MSNPLQQARTGDHWLTSQPAEDRTLPLPTQGSEIREVLRQAAGHGNPDRDAARLLDVGSGPFLAFFEQEILAALVGQGGATCRFFEGACGAGKTHLLQLLADVALRCGMAVAWTDLDDGVTLANWRSLSAHLLRVLEMRVGGQVVRGLPAILGALRRQGAPLQPLRAAHLPHPGFQQALLAVLEGPEGAEFHTALHWFLAGERVDAAAGRRAGYPEGKGDRCQRNADQILTTVLSGLGALGVPGSILLFDDHDANPAPRNGRLTTRSRVATPLMCGLIDGCADGDLARVTAVFAVSTGFLQDCYLACPGLRHRLAVPGGTGIAPSWRWPLLSVDAVSAARTPAAFLDQAALHLTTLVEQHGGEAAGLRHELLAAGREVLLQETSGGYRRPLMKRLASAALRRMLRR